MSRALFLLAALVALSACNQQQPQLLLATPGEVDRAIRGGVLGADFAERALKCETLHVRREVYEGIDLSFFSFSDYQAGYTVLVEGGGLVLLCGGFGGGYARDVQLVDDGGQATLHYKYDIGSGRQQEYSGHYVLGSGTAVTDS